MEPIERAAVRISEASQSQTVDLDQEKKDQEQEEDDNQDDDQDDVQDGRERGGERNNDFSWRVYIYRSVSYSICYQI